MTFQLLAIIQNNWLMFLIISYITKDMTPLSLIEKKSVQDFWPLVILAFSLDFIVFHNVLHMLWFG